MTASRILYNVHARQLLDKNDFMKPMVRVLAAFNTLADGLDRAVKG